MSNLLSLLSLGSGGITAQNTGVSVATNNVANVNTRGYSRQRVDLEALLGAPLVGGVRSGRPDRLHDTLLDGRIRSAAGSLAMSRSFTSALADLESRLAERGPALEEQLAGVFSRLQHVAAAPTDGALRAAVVSGVRDLAAGIRDRAADLGQATSETNQRIRDNVEVASDLARRLADANRDVARTNDPALRDHRDQLATELAQRVGGAARIDPDGQLRFVLPGGAVLVDGSHAATLQAQPDPITLNYAVFVVDGASQRDVSTAVGGSVGADTAFRDGALARARGDLDQLAFDLASQMNLVHAANVGLDGGTGRPMFVPPAQVAGAAALLAIDPALDADPALLATRAPGGGPGDNGGALALFGLASAPIATGGRTLAAAAIDLVAVVGTTSVRARGELARAELIDAHLETLRDSLSGVDIEEELANLARFQHAASAMTSFVRTIDEMLGDLIDRL